MVRRSGTDVMSPQGVVADCSVRLVARDQRVAEECPEEGRQVERADDLLWVGVLAL